MEKEKIQLNIAGKNYTMLSSESKEKLQRIAAYVGRKIDEIYLTSRMSTEEAAVITAMNVAEELMQSQDENSRLRRELRKIQNESSENQKKA